MATRAEKLRRRQHRKEKKRSARAQLSELARAEFFVSDEPTSAGKMSEALLALVQPEWNICHDEEAMRKLLTVGLAAWNAALMKAADRMAFLDSLAQKLPSELRQDFKQIVEPFIRRKDEMFPDNQRPIFSFELTPTPSGNPRLVVLSGLS
jgi:hypothetical protein